MTFNSQAVAATPKDQEAELASLVDLELDFSLFGAMECVPPPQLLQAAPGMAIAAPALGSVPAAGHQHHQQTTPMIFDSTEAKLQHLFPLPKLRLKPEAWRLYKASIPALTDDEERSLGKMRRARLSCVCVKNPATGFQLSLHTLIRICSFPFPA